MPFKYESVPYAASVWVPAKHAHVLAKKMTKQAGGSTRRDAWGEWLDDNGNLHGEPVSIVTGYFASDRAAQQAVTDAAETLIVFGELAVLIEVDDLRTPQQSYRRIVRRA